jgi:hypothetical protein
MKYMQLLWALDSLAKAYPKFHSHELFTLADDIWKWLNNELPKDSSKLIYLKSLFPTSAEAFHAIIKEIQLLAGPLMNKN